MKKTRIAASVGTLLVALMLLGGCGQKGPLTLPKADPQPAKSAQPASAPQR